MLDSAHRFLATSTASDNDEDDDDDIIDGNNDLDGWDDADDFAVRYGIEANRNRLPTPEPSSRPTSSCHSATSDLDSQDERVLAKLRSIEGDDHRHTTTGMATWREQAYWLARGGEGRGGGGGGG